MAICKTCDYTNKPSYKCKKLLTWIPRDNWELGCEYECPYCGEMIDIPHGSIMPNKCKNCGNEIGVK